MEGLKPREEIDLIELCKSIWLGKFFLFGAVLVGCVIGCAYLGLTPKTYKSEVLVMLSPELGDSASASSTLSGLAGLAGINLNGGDSQALVLAKLKSHAFLSKFIEDADLIKPILAGVHYDEDSSSLAYDQDLVNPASGDWIQVPSKNAAVRQFLKSWLSVTKDKEGFISIGVESVSPDLAYLTVSQLVLELNVLMQRETIKRAENRIKYLKKQLLETQITDMKNIFYQLIEQQIKTVMLAKATDQYALRVVDPAVRPEHVHGPNFLFVMVAAVGISSIIGVLLASLVGFQKLKNA